MELGLPKFQKIDWNEEPNSREKVFFFIILAMISVAFMRLLWVPTYQSIKQKRMEITNIRLQIKTLEEFVKVNSKLEEKKPKQNIGEQDFRLEQALQGKLGDPHQVIADVTSDITSRRNIGSILLQNISFEPLQMEAGYVRFPLTVNVSGTYSVLQSYLSKLERLNYLFTVDNVKIVMSQDTPGIINAELKCMLFIASTGNVKMVMPPNLPQPEKKEP